MVLTHVMVDDCICFSRRVYMTYVLIALVMLRPNVDWTVSRTAQVHNGAGMSIPDTVCSRGDGHLEHEVL
jgi:hypothetical protein